MVVVVSLYPLLASKTGFTRIYNDDDETSPDALKQVHLLKRCVENVLDSHSDQTDEFDDEDCNEFERYTLIVTFQKSLNVARGEFPITIPHSKPVRYTCTQSFRDMTKKEILAKLVEDLKDIAEQVAEEEEEEDEQQALGFRGDDDVSETEKPGEACDEMMNDCEHGRFYHDWSQCHYRDCPLDEDMKNRVEKCRVACVEKLRTLNYPYIMEVPDRMYALKARECVCGAEDEHNTICTCPRPESVTLDYDYSEPTVLTAKPFTAIDITIDCERYNDVKKVYETLGVRDDNESADDDRVHVYCMRKNYLDEPSN